MTGTTDHVLYAAILFVGIHVLSSTPLRAVVVRRLGEAAFQGLFSLLSIAAFAWMLLAYGAAPFEPLWSPPPWTGWLTFLFMLPACFFTVAALTSRNPSMAGRARELRDPNPATGILTITRHPLFWGFAFFAVGHLLANGDRASVWLFGTIALLALAGMPLQDRKKEELAGADWGPFAMRTSALPFQAAIQGRTKIDWAGIGWWRPLLALALFVALMAVHETAFGVRILLW